MCMCNMRVKYEIMCTRVYVKTYVCTSAPVVPGFLFLGLGPLPCLTLQLHKEQSGLITVKNKCASPRWGVRGCQSPELRRLYPEFMYRLIYVCMYMYQLCIRIHHVSISSVMLTRYAEPLQMYGPL